MISWAFKNTFNAILSQKRWAPRRQGQKVPLDNNGLNLRWKDPATWMSVPEIDNQFQDFGLFTGNGVVGIDIDGCVDPQTKAVDPWAQMFLESLGPAYVEYSLSKNGVHAFFQSNTNAPITLPQKTEVNAPNLHGKQPAIEIYVDPHYITVSNDPTAFSQPNITSIDIGQLQMALSRVDPLKKEKFSYKLDGLESYNGYVEPDESVIRQQYEYFMRTGDRSNDELSLVHWCLERNYKIDSLVSILESIPGSKFLERRGTGYTVGTITNSWGHVSSIKKELWGSNFLKQVQQEDAITGGAGIKFLNQDEEESDDDLFGGMDWGEIRTTEFKVDYYIEDVLVKGQPCGLGAKSKTMKTTIATDLAVSLLTGGPFLNKFTVNETCRHVSFFSGESGVTKLKDTFTACFNNHRVNSADLDMRLRVFPKLPHFDDMESLKRLRRAIRYRQSDVVIVDPLYLCIGATDTNSSAMYGRLLDRVHEIVLENEATLILLAHTNKTNRSGKEHGFLDIDDFTGSGLQLWLRQWILLNRRAEYQHNNIHELNLAIGGSEGHSGAYELTIRENFKNPFVRYECSFECNEKGASKKPDPKLLMIGAIQELGSEAKASKIRARLKWSGNTFKVARDALIEANIIQVNQNIYSLTGL